MHSWSGPHGVPGGTERWEHGSYRWRRLLEAALLIVLAVVMAPKVLALAEVVAGAGLMALGLLMLVPRLRRAKRANARYKVGLLALLLAVVALVEARRKVRRQ